MHSLCVPVQLLHISLFLWWILPQESDESSCIGLREFFGCLGFSRFGKCLCLSSLGLDGYTHSCRKHPMPRTNNSSSLLQSIFSAKAEMLHMPTRSKFQTFGLLTISRVIPGWMFWLRISLYLNIWSHIWIFCHQGIALSERIRKCGNVGRSVSLGVGLELSKAHTKTRVSLSQPGEHDVDLSYFSGTIAAYMPPCFLSLR